MCNLCKLHTYEAAVTTFTHASNVAIECKLDSLAATCKLEDAVMDAKVVLDSDKEKETYVEDERVILKCDLAAGYQLAGGVNSLIVRVCLSNLTWSGMDPNCTRSK